MSLAKEHETAPNSSLMSVRTHAPNLHELKHIGGPMSACFFYDFLRVCILHQEFICEKIHVLKHYTSLNIDKHILNLF